MEFSFQKIHTLYLNNKNCKDYKWKTTHLMFVFEKFCELNWYESGFCFNIYDYMFGIIV